jgi:hypothetical protein
MCKALISLNPYNESFVKMGSLKTMKNTKEDQLHDNKEINAVSVGYCWNQRQIIKET